MTKIEQGLLKFIGIAVALLVGLGTLWTIFRLFWFGSYWATAPIWLCAFVGFIVPLFIIWAVIRLTIFIWKI